MGVVEDRVYWATRAGLPSDNVPGLTLQQLIDMATAEGPDKTWGDLTNYLKTQQIAVGEETIPRSFCLNTAEALAVTQTLRLTYFTCRKTESISQVKMVTGATAAGATPSLIRIGLYTVAANGDLALVASTATDTALFAAANTAYTKALSTAYVKVMGQRYALGLLVNSAAAFPSIAGAPAEGSILGLVSPLMHASVAAQADLPASVLAASQVASVIGPHYCELLP